MRHNQPRTLEEMIDMYVVTTAQREAKPNWDFMRALEQYAKHNEAEILILPTNGANTGIKTMEEEQLHPYFTDNFQIVSEDTILNNNLEIRHFPVKAQQMDPTTSWDRFVGYDTSAIMPSPKQRMRVVANSNTNTPKVLMSTGACTVPNYRDNNWGVKAQLDHQYGAIVVDIEDDELFHYRQLRANVNGAFYDLGLRYSGTGKPKRERVEALVMGDYHCAQIDPEVLATTKELIKEVNPKHLILHDFFDGFSINHHKEHKLVERATTARNLTEELYQAGSHLQALKEQFPKTKIVVVKSNHDEVIDRYLEEGRFVKDPENLSIATDLLRAKLDGKDPLEYGVNHVYGKIHGVKWLSRDDDFKIRGWQLANHGDLGANGSRGSIRGLEQACGRAIYGHAHTPQIYRNVFQVGVSTPVNGPDKPNYARGPSSWMNTHALLSPNGQPQLVNLIKGKYKANHND